MNPVVYIVLLMVIAFALGSLLTLLWKRDNKVEETVAATPNITAVTITPELKPSKPILSDDHLERGHDRLDLAQAYHEMGEHEQTQQVLYELLRLDDRVVQRQAVDKLVAWYPLAGVPAHTS